MVSQSADRRFASGGLANGVSERISESHTRTVARARDAGAPACLTTFPLLPPSRTYALALACTPFALPLHCFLSISVLNYLDAQAMALEEIQDLPNPPSLVHMAVIEGALEMIPLQEYSRPPSNTGWLEKQEIFLRDDLLNQMTTFNPQHARAMSSRVRCHFGSANWLV